MKTPLRSRYAIAVLCVVALAGTCHAQIGRRQAAAPPTATQPAPSGGRDTAHYVADQPVDFLHMKLELTFTRDGLSSRTCEGRVEYTLKPRAGKVGSVRLDAVDMQILGVELPGQNGRTPFSYDDRHITVPLPDSLGRDAPFKLAVKYRLADPVKGVHFVLPNASRPKRPLMVYSMSEPLEARYWFPAHDWPNARWTSDILITVPSGYTAVANGVLQSKKQSGDGQSVTYHWRNEVPTDPHLVGMALGELVELRDHWRDKPVTVYTPPGTEAAAAYTCRRVPEMLTFYSELTGVEFPYPGYTHVVVVDHHHGGMEHAGFSFVAPRFLATSDDGDWPLEHTESNYLSHMLAHQWFGGIVNYRSVSQAWLNEGFAVLLDSLWTTHTDAPPRFECKMWETARRIAFFDSSETGKPLVVRDLENVGDIYQLDGSKVYVKGAWVLQMLRHMLGEEVFWRGVANYLSANRFKGVETSDLRRALEEVSGRDQEQFFQQWVYGHGVPRLDVAYSWDEARRRATVTVQQTQKIDKATPAFAFPLDLYFRVGDKDKNVTVSVVDARHEFTFDFAEEPAIFCVDPRGGLLKTLTARVPRAMLRRQAQDGPTALSRLMAVEELSRQRGPQTVDVLEQVLVKPAEFWMVRRAAADGLGRMQTEAALAALLRAEKECAAQPRVLAGVLEALGGYVVSPEAQGRVLQHAGSPKLYVEMAAVSALGRMRASPELVEKSLKALQAATQKSSRRAVRGAALNALAALDDRRYYETVFQLAQPGDDELRGQAITALGRLGRLEGLGDRTRTALTAWLYDPDASAQEAAAAGLGALGDARAIADLERLRGSARAEGVRNAAQRALDRIRRPEDPRQANTALLERLAALEKQNQQLERRLKELADRLEPSRKTTRDRSEKPGAKP
jgi:aminopeptidase N